MFSLIRRLSSCMLFWYKGVSSTKVVSLLLLLLNFPLLVQPFQPSWVISISSSLVGSRSSKNEVGAVGIVSSPKRKKMSSSDNWDAELGVWKGNKALDGDTEEIPKPLYIFGYGSLVFRPQASFAHCERYNGYVKGWKRVWAQRSTGTFFSFSSLFPFPLLFIFCVV